MRIYETQKNGCSNPQHFPGPMLLYVPPGETYTYECPTCGHITLLKGAPECTL